MSRDAGLLLLRADASPMIGSGHVSRCLCLAEAWIEAGGNVCLAVSAITPALLERAKIIGIKVHHQLEPIGSRDDAICTARYAEHADLVVLDGYDFDREYQKILTDLGAVLLVLDDVAGIRQFDCRWLLNPNIHAVANDYTSLVATNTQLLLGTEYALLSQEYEKRPTRTHAGPIRNILVSLGGGDSTEATNFVLAALARENIDADVVISVLVAGGDTTRVRDQALRLHLDVDVVEGFVSDMAERLFRADIGIIAGGTTSLEALRAGLPCVALAIAGNQVPSCVEFDRRGALLYAGMFGSTTNVELGHPISRLLTTPELRQQLSEIGQLLVDGQGARRLTYMMRETCCGKQDNTHIDRRVVN